MSESEKGSELKNKHFAKNVSKVENLMFFYRKVFIFTALPDNKQSAREVKDNKNVSRSFSIKIDANKNFYSSSFNWEIIGSINSAAFSFKICSS